MTPAQIAALQARINALSNGTVRQAAQSAFNVAGSGNSYSFEQLESMLNQSARVDGKTAIFYSGDSGRNVVLADDCANTTLEQNGYLLKDTTLAARAPVIPAQAVNKTLNVGCRASASGHPGPLISNPLCVGATGSG